MANLELQRKSCRIVVGVYGEKEGRVCRFLPKDFDFHTALNELSQYGLRYYAIKHDKDLTEHDYEHIHLVLVSSKILRFSQYLNIVSECFGCDTTNVSIRETTDISKNIQYLVHKGIKDKYQYNYEELKTNDSIDNLNAILNAEVVYDETITTDTLIEIIKKSTNVIELITELGVSYFNRNVRTIQIICNSIGKEGYFR